MYKDFFSFIKEPFNITPDTELFYCSKVHEEILNVIEYQLEKRRGFILLTGDVGTGKTSICRILLNKLLNYQTSLILNPFLNAKEILYYICKDFDIISDEKEINEAQLFHLLTEFLVQVYKNRKNALIIVDEAQNLSFEAFEMIRQISNIELENTKLVQILFVGQSELLQKVNSEKLRQLRQRISVILELKPLSYEDTINYINFRVQESLKYKKFIFSSGAIKKIYHYTRGYPREINQVAEIALIIAFNKEHKIVTKKDVEEAAKEFYKIDTFKSKHGFVLIIPFLLILIGTGVYLYNTNLSKKSNNFYHQKTNVKKKIIDKKQLSSFVDKEEKSKLKSSIKNIQKTIEKNNRTKLKQPTVTFFDNKTKLNKVNKTPKKSNKKILVLHKKHSYDKKSENITKNKKVYYNIFLGPLRKDEINQKVEILKKHKIDFFVRDIKGKYFIFLGYFKFKKSVENLKAILSRLKCDNKFNVKKIVK